MKHTLLFLLILCTSALAVERPKGSLAAGENIVLEREDWYAITEAGRGRRIP